MSSLEQICRHKPGWQPHCSGRCGVGDIHPSPMVSWDTSTVAAQPEVERQALRSSARAAAVTSTTRSSIGPSATVWVVAIAALTAGPYLLLGNGFVLDDWF